MAPAAAEKKRQRFIGSRRHAFPENDVTRIARYTPLRILPYKYRFQMLESVENWKILSKLRHINAGKPYILFMNCPNLLYPYPLDELLKNSAFSLFDLSDDFVEVATNMEVKDIFLSNITKYAQAADTVLTVNEHVKAKYSHLSENIHVFKNATNYFNFDRQNFNTRSFSRRAEKTWAIL